MGSENTEYSEQSPIGECSQVVIGAPEAAPGLVPIAAPDGNGALVALRDGYELTTLPGPVEGYRRHQFDDVTTFAGWLNRHAFPESTEIMVSADAVMAILNPAHPTPERATCSLKHHPTFAAWLGVFGKELQQKAFHEVVRGFRHSVSGSGPLLQALRVIAVAKGGEFRSEIDETGATRLALVSDKREMTAKLPPEFQIHCPVYQGIVAPAGEPLVYPIEALVSISVDGQLPTFTVTAPALELVTNEARFDVRNMLDEILEDGFLVGLGNAAHATRAAKYAHAPSEV